MERLLRPFPAGSALEGTVSATWCLRERCGKRSRNVQVEFRCQRGGIPVEFRCQSIFSRVEFRCQWNSGVRASFREGIPVSAHLFARRTTTTAKEFRGEGIPVSERRNSGVRASFRSKEFRCQSIFSFRNSGVSGIPVSEHLFARRTTTTAKEFRCQSIFSFRNSGVRASFRVADDHDGAAHGRCRGDGK